MQHERHATHADVDMEEGRIASIVPLNTIPKLGHATYVAVAGFILILGALHVGLVVIPGTILKEGRNDADTNLLQRRMQSIEGTVGNGTFESARPGPCCTQAPSHTIFWSDFENSDEAVDNQSKGLPLVVPCGIAVVVDKNPSHRLHGLQVMGELTFQDGIDIKVETEFVFVCGNFSIGSLTQAHRSKVEIVLMGSTEVIWRLQNGVLKNFGRTGFVTYGGSTYIRGTACGATSWTRLAQPLSTGADAAGNGPNELASNQQASQSSLGHHRYKARMAVDGRWNWKYSSMLTRREANPWWQVRILAAESGVGMVKVWPRSGSRAKPLFKGVVAQREREWVHMIFDGPDEGAIVGVTDAPCTGDGCGGTQCGRITKPVSSGPYVINCNGAKGSYVYVQLPGELRELGLEEVQVFRAPMNVTRELKLRDTNNPMSWKRGDRLVITSTSRNPLETEEVTVEGINGSSVSFAENIAHRHDGCTDCVMAAEVASMTRNIVIRGDEGCAPMCGHFQIAHTNHGFVCGAEFTNLGQTKMEGRYPLHIHMPGEAHNIIVKDNALHHNHNRGVVMHGVHNMLVQSNLCYKTKGHCFMTEDGVEQYNRILGNLGLLPSPQHFGCSQTHDSTFLCPHRSDHHPNAFWISNPLNTFEGNVGIAASGAFFTETRHVMGLTRREFEPEARKVGRQGKIKGSIPFLAFRNNVAHSSGMGLGNYPRFNWGPINGHTSRYEHFTAWRCGLGMAVHNGGRGMASIVGATLFENTAGFSASTSDARVELTSSRIKAGNANNWPLIRKKIGFTKEKDLLKIFSSTDSYTRNWVRCYGGFSEKRLSGIFTNTTYYQPCDEVAYSP